MIDLAGVSCAADVARAQAERGDSAAQTFEGRTTTFAEVDEMASRIANALIAAGLQPQERVAYLSKNTDHFLPFLLGACKARMTLDAGQLPSRRPGDHPPRRRQRRANPVSSARISPIWRKGRSRRSPPNPA